MINLSLDVLKLIAKFRGIKGYKRMPEDKLISALNASESVKTIREIRKENLDEGKILRDLDFYLNQKKIIMNLNKLLALLIITIFNIKIRR